MLQINTLFTDRFFLHGKIGKKLGDHTQAELRLLAIQGLKSGNPAILDCFIGLPTLDSLIADKVTNDIAKIAKPVTTPNPTA